MIYQPPKEPYLDVVYHDEDVLVLNKPSGLLSVPGRKPEHKDSLQNRAQERYPEATTVHRLDMETSGLMVMALNKPSHVSLSRQFEQRLVKKQYLARVFGHLEQDSGQVEAPLICDWPNRPKQMIDYENGKKAITHWTVIDVEKQTTLVQLNPITGRSHQLRVHMLSIGHPIVGDQLYADGEALDYAPRLALQSQSIQFVSLNHQNELLFSLPADF